MRVGARARRLLLLLPLALGAGGSCLDAQAQSDIPSYRWGLLTAVTVPQPLSIGLLAVPSDHPDLAYFIEGGYFRFGFGKNRTINDASVAVGVRYRPFSDWFVTGINFGYRRFGVSVDISSLQSEGTPIASQANLHLNALFFGLFVGGQWNLSPNVVFGVDLGLQMAALAWGAVTIDADPSATDPTDLSVDDSAAMRRVASIPIPQIALVRFIWYL
jgi:hypothetical protein